MFPGFLTNRYAPTFLIENYFEYLLTLICNFVIERFLLCADSYDKTTDYRGTACCLFKVQLFPFCIDTCLHCQKISKTRGCQGFFSTFTVSLTITCRMKFQFQGFWGSGLNNFKVQSVPFWSLYNSAMLCFQTYFVKRLKVLAIKMFDNVSPGQKLG